jgi:hypothetical protein
MSEPTSQDQQESPDSPGAGLGAVVLHHTVTALLLVLIIALGVWAYLTFRKTNFFETPDPSAVTRVQTYALEAQASRIRFALGVHYRLDGRYPADLSDLVERGLLLSSDLYYPAGTAALSYRRTASGYALERTTPQ